MEWKKGIPTTPGYYWVYKNNGWPPIIVEVDDGGVYGINQDFEISYGEEEEYNSYYWLGPIEIPNAPTGEGGGD